MVSGLLHFNLLTWCVALFTVVRYSEPKLAREISCGACKLLIEELELGIRKVDPRKTIQVGSFRVDPKGNQKLNEIPFARSETHLHELVENVCDNSNKWGVIMHPDTKRETYVRNTDDDGRSLNIEGLDMSASITVPLKRSCENIVEEYEEAVINLLTKDHSDALRKFCVDQTGFCDKDDLVSARQPDLKSNEEAKVSSTDDKMEL